MSNTILTIEIIYIVLRKTGSVVEFFLIILQEQTPLHWASATGKEQCIDKLIKGGANVNLQADNVCIFVFSLPLSVPSIQYVIKHDKEIDWLIV